MSFLKRALTCMRSLAVTVSSDFPVCHRESLEAHGAATSVFRSFHFARKLPSSECWEVSSLLELQSVLNRQHCRKKRPSNTLQYDFTIVYKSCQSECRDVTGCHGMSISYGWQKTFWSETASPGGSKETISEFLPSIEMPECGSGWNRPGVGLGSIASKKPWITPFSRISRPFPKFAEFPVWSSFSEGPMDLHTCFGVPDIPSSAGLKVQSPPVR